MVCSRPICLARGFLDSGSFRGRIPGKELESMGRRSSVAVEDRVEAVLAMLRKEEPVAVLSRRYSVSEQTLYRWRDEFVEGGQGPTTAASTGLCWRTPFALCCWGRSAPCVSKASSTTSRSPRGASPCRTRSASCFSRGPARRGEISRFPPPRLPLRVHFSPPEVREPVAAGRPSRPVRGWPGER